MKRVTLLKKLNLIIEYRSSVAMVLESSNEASLLNFFRQQEARTLLTILNFNPEALDRIEERTRDLIERPKYCGENHQKHYLTTLAKLKHGKNSTFGH